MGNKFVNFFKNAFDKIKVNTKRGIDWVGEDGLINMETAALLVIFLMIFFPAIWSMLISVFIVLGKCAMDKRNGHKDECHDFVCAIIGVVVGVILGMAHAATILFFCS